MTIPGRALVVLCLLGTGCSPAESDDTSLPSTAGGSQAASPNVGSGAPSAGASAQAPSPAAGEFVNPVLENFPDPDVLQVGTPSMRTRDELRHPQGQGSNIQCELG